MSNKVGRNDLCPCESGLKYKNCYGKGLETCILFVNENNQTMLEKHAEKDKLVFRFFEDTLADMSSIFAKDENGLEVVASRVQLISIFTLIDVFASYWYEYHNQNGKPSERFCQWLSQFCFTEENEEYSDSIYVNITPERLYQFRSSLVHFFGLSRTDTDTFGIVPNDEEAKKIMESYIKQKKGSVMYMVDSKKLHSLVSEGAVLMLNGWSDVIKEAQQNEHMKMEHIRGIDRIYKKVMLEGAIRVPFKPNNA